jgi:alpha-galactosidase
MTAVNELVSLGLIDVGYEYVNSKQVLLKLGHSWTNESIVDDCWSIKSGRDNVTNQIVPDPTSPRWN